jgi:hypothetical protein
VRCVYPLLTGLCWLVATRASLSGGRWRRQLTGRCPAQHAVDHYVNGEAKPFVGISSDQLSGVATVRRDPCILVLRDRMVCQGRGADAHTAGWRHSRRTCWRLGACDHRPVLITWCRALRKAIARLLPGGGLGSGDARAPRQDDRQDVEVAAAATRAETRTSHTPPGDCGAAAARSSAGRWRTVVNAGQHVSAARGLTGGEARGQGLGAGRDQGLHHQPGRQPGRHGH